MDASGLGHATLTLAVAAAGVATVAALAGTRPGRARWASAARGALALAALAAAAATAVLARALVRLDLSLVYVAEVARRSAARPYRLAGLWAGNGGSLLLWTALLAAVAAVSSFTVRRRAPALAAAHTACAAGVVAALAGISRLAADPFGRLAIPAIDGGGLVPILQHGAMLVHPPMVYAGLTLLLAPFATTVAALAHRSLDTAWSALVRRWALASWAVLLAAMAIGGHWAYDQLAWGGYWAWDPVENGVLLPWLTLTAALHASRRGRRGTEAALVLATFVLAGVGAFVARSGVTASVHAFAEARRIGVALAVVAALTVGVAAAAFAHGAPPRSRTHDRSWLRVNTIGLVTVTVLVLLGTLAPVVRGWIDGRERVVDAGFYAPVVLPCVLALLVALGLASTPSVRGRLVGAALAVATAVGFLLTGHAGPGAVALAAAAAFAAVGVVAGLVRRGPTGAADESAPTADGPATGPGRARRAVTRHGGDVVHLGLVVLLLGVAGTTMGVDRVVTVGAGTTVAVRGYDLTVGELAAVARDDRSDVVVPVTVRRRGRLVATLHPAWRVARPSGLAVAVADRRATLLEDLQVVPTRVAPPASVLLAVRVRPLARWVWIGAAVMVAGAVLARLGATGRSGRTTGPAAGAESGATVRHPVATPATD